MKAERELELRILLEVRRKDLDEADQNDSPGAAMGAAMIYNQIVHWEEEYRALTGKEPPK